MEHTLPRVRSRRRRRRPFGPNEWMALAMVVEGAIAMIFALVLGTTRDFGKPFPMFVAGTLTFAGGTMVWAGWPILSDWLEGED